MAILGLTRQGSTFRFVLCEHSKGTVEARKFGEVHAESWTDAIMGLREETGARELAVAIESPDLYIQEVDVSNLVKEAEKRGAVRNKAIMLGFEDRDDIRVRTDEDGTWYFAALRASVKREILQAAAAARMRLVRIENAAYSWVRLLDGRFNALVDASTENRVAVLVIGGRRAELRVLDATKPTLLEDIEATFDGAVRHGFATSLQAAVIDPAETLRSVKGISSGTLLIGKTELEPYTGVVPGNNVGFAVPLGVVFAAVGGASPRNLLDIDFTERERVSAGEILAPISARLPRGDLLAVGSVALCVLLGAGAQWFRGTQYAMQAASLQTVLVQRAGQAEAIKDKATIVAREAKRLADANAARQSGGVAARRLAQWMRALPNGVTLESVTYDGLTGDVTVTGDAERLAAAELAYRVINQPSSKFAQTGSTFTVEREVVSGSSSSPAASPVPAVVATPAAPAPLGGANVAAPPAQTAGSGQAPPAGGAQ